MKRTFGCAHVILWAAACGCGGDDGEPSETVGASTNADGGTSEVGSSDDAGTSSDAGGSTELPAVLTLSGSAWPEDVLAVDDRLFASNFVLGGIQVIDLGDPSAGSTEFVPAATDDRTSWWGMKADPVRNTLIVVANAPYAFDGNVTAPGEVRAYDLADGELSASWLLPEGTVGNSVVLDGDGRIYVGDVSTTARIVAIDPDSGAVEVWKEDPVQWDAIAAGGFGLGGMAFDGTDRIFTSFGGALWVTTIEPDGTAGPLSTIALTDEAGAPFQLAADGMTWGGSDELYFAANDAFQTGSNGVLYRATLQGTSGSVDVVADGLTDPSGAHAAEIDGRRYIFAAESQFGHLFGFDEGDPSLPFEVRVFTR